MAEYRSVQTKIWDDEWFTELETDAKLFFVYLITNHRASVAGIYRLLDKYAAVESGLTVERIHELYKEFEAAGKVFYENGIVWVKRLRHYQDTGSDAVGKRIGKDIDEIPDCELKRRYLEFYGQSPDGPKTVPILSLETSPDTDTDTVQDTKTKQIPAEPLSQTDEPEPYRNNNQTTADRLTDEFCRTFKTYADTLKAKNAAKKHFKALLNTGFTKEEILLAFQKLKADCPADPAPWHIKPERKKDPFAGAQRGFDPDLPIPVNY